MEIKLINRGKRIKKEIFCGQQLQINFSWEKEGCVECQKYVPGCKSHWWKLGGLCENNQNLPKCLTKIIFRVPSTYLHLPDTLFTLNECERLWVQLSTRAAGLRPTHCKAKSHDIVNKSKVDTWREIILYCTPPSGTCRCFWTLVYLHISNNWTRIPIKFPKSNVNVSCGKEGLMDRTREEELDNYLRREKEEVEAEEADISCSHSSSGS